MTTLWGDLRFGVRVLGRNPGFTAVAILVLGLGIGANTAVFSVVNALLLKPLAGVDSGPAVLGLYSKDLTRPDRYRAFSYPNYVDIRDTIRAFSSILACDIGLAGVTEGETTRRAFVLMVSANYFDTLDGKPARGRAFTRDEERPGAGSTVTVVSDSYWKRHGSDPELIGRTVLISSRPFTVVGIAPPGFTGNSALVVPEFWVPLSAAALIKNDVLKNAEGAPDGSRAASALMLIGRLAPGVSAERAGAELAQVAARLAEAFPAENKDQTIVAAPLPRTGISTEPGDDRRIVGVSVVLQAVSSVVLLVACLNLANMLLARGTARRREMAIRLSIGASRTAVIRQLLVEGFLLAVAGGVLGVVLAEAATAAFIGSARPLFPVPVNLSSDVDWRVVAVTLCFAVVATLVFALGPAWRITKPGILDDLKDQRVGSGGRGARLFGVRNLLLMSQMALSLALLVSGALFVRGAFKAADATPGFSFDNGLLVEVDPALAGYTPDQSLEAHRGLLARLRSVPGVQAVSIASTVPFGSERNGTGVERASGDTAGATGQGRPERISATSTIIGADYFRSLGLSVLRGREFTPAEAEGVSARRVAIIDEPLARRLFPEGENPVGQYVRIPGRDPWQGGEPLEVVGVVPGLRDRLFDRSPVPHLYRPFAMEPLSGMNYHIRLDGGEAAAPAMAETIRREIRGFDPRLPVLALRTLRTFADQSPFLWIYRSAARIFTVFGLAALLLALVGIYGVNAYVVARRTREIGIRMALGATAQDVVTLIARDAFVVAGVGVTVGLGLAIALGTVISSMLYDVSVTDPLVLVVMPLMLAGAAMLASYVPARRATRIAPVSALHYDG
jgi:predicted permease